MYVLRSTEYDMWTRSVAARYPKHRVVVLTPKAAGWTASLLRDAVMENAAMARRVEAFVASDMPVAMRNRGAAPRLALLVTNSALRVVVAQFRKAKVGLLRTVGRPRGTAADPAGTSLTLGGFVADKNAARSPLRAVLGAADRLSIDPDSVNTTNPRDQLHVRGAAAFRGCIVTILDSIFADVDEAHTRLLADWMVAGRLRTYTESSLDRLTAMFFRRTEAAMRTATIAGAEVDDSIILKTVIGSERYPCGTCFTETRLGD